MDMRYTKRVEREMMLLIMKCLAMFRKSKGYTTKDMAEYIGVSQSLYEKIEFGASLNYHNYHTLKGGEIYADLFPCFY